MPFVVAILGITLLIAAVRGTQDKLFVLVHGDFTGPNNFIYWFLAIFLIGSLGYIPKLKPVSTVFLTLVVLVLVLTKGNPNGSGGGFFSQFTSQVASTTKSTTPGATTPGFQPSASMFDDLLKIQVPDLSTLFK